ncbi:MAG: RNA 2',3'-cyclic phosphodiesterase [Methanosphaera sp.]|uniref:RNA 2',3'-cyclic phosphodiesterase n=1 Tax=Methanosphaera sp. ISO3-F5 TaxID=1452353 RepID=UPI002B2634AC|nr:RNA 2',3'-cyclic phosphodiesterase [Methanosphaera sp. ISO3-F5]MBR0472166.1 RNA 2',3'-cyclic phosphodiesterase [Methanosphaera sp.]WQH65000.1 RNA 2',3'-cyclic phosphodiesterase [Methanosphaera sp. ISO3-F5]
MRTFLAIEIEDYIKNKINETQHIIQEKDAGKIKYVETENIHLTLKFFGEINEDQLDDIKKAINKIIVKYDQYSLKVVNLGAFPNIYRPRVIWTGIKDNKVTSNLIRDLDNEFNKLGFRKEKEYVPHITIGRVKKIEDKEELSSALKLLKKRYHGKMEVKKICLKSSKLTSDGPIYKNIAEFKLGD